MKSRYKKLVLLLSFTFLGGVQAEKEQLPKFNHMKNINLFKQLEKLHPNHEGIPPLLDHLDSEGQKTYLSARVDDKGNIITTEKNPIGWIKLKVDSKETTQPVIVCKFGDYKGVELVILSLNEQRTKAFLEYGLVINEKFNYYNTSIAPGSVINALDKKKVFYYDSTKQEYLDHSFGFFKDVTSRKKYGNMPTLLENSNKDLIQALASYNMPPSKNLEGTEDFYYFKGKTSTDIDIYVGIKRGIAGRINFTDLKLTDPSEDKKPKFVGNSSKCYRTISH